MSNALPCCESLSAHVRPAAFNDLLLLAHRTASKARLSCISTQCSYVGPAPVQLSDFTRSASDGPGRPAIDPIDSGSIASLVVYGISYQDELLDQLARRINSNTGLFLLGPPGNGKTDIARQSDPWPRQEIWIPHAILDDGSIWIKLKDDRVSTRGPRTEGTGSYAQSQECGQTVGSHPTSRAWSSVVSW